MDFNLQKYKKYNNLKKNSLNSNLQWKNITFIIIFYNIYYLL